MGEKLDISEDQLQTMNQDQINMLIVRNLIEIKAAQKPMVDAFNAASTVGKWLMGTLVFLSVTIGVVIEIDKLIPKK